MDHPRERRDLMRSKRLAVTAVIALALGALGIPTAHADADTVVTVTIKNLPDNGHGSPKHWADRTFTRTIIVHPVAGKSEVTVKDSGTLVTRKGAGSPNNDVTIARKLPGTYTSTIHHTPVEGVLDADKVGDIDGNVYDVKAGVNPPATEAWSKILFETGATGGAISSYQFLYQTLEETWDERWNDGTDDRFDNNNDGQNSTAGDITGKLTSKLTLANLCRVSKADKRNRWLVKNVQGDRPRTFSYWVKYNGVYSAHFSATVAPGGSVVITTPFGGRASLYAWDGYAVRIRLYAWSNHTILC
jgi:hypothetical protein